MLMDVPHSGSPAAIEPEGLPGLQAWACLLNYDFLT